ncbi:hypothetical protein KC360_g7726 [Hortaea werneckii]|nr:hypothetical protein KC325_g7735 [Hortaea werneckii]KAI6987902.1 hypothetical protein KC359_g8037 [Hortaea werneckii]KAI7141811.1 hypothetical protein KC344_g7696 [Hortaea werneckii]KAI7169025.1 hypothetical protein KC360_g7726 [Hortaea werneckii]
MDGAARSSSGRTALVCEPCRIRHRKCDFESAVCKQCWTNDLECVRQPAIKFRYDAHQRALARRTDNVQRSLPPLKANVEFIDECPSLVAHYTGYSAPEPIREDASQCQTAGTETEHGIDVTEAVINFQTAPVSNQTSPEDTLIYVTNDFEAIAPFTEQEAHLIRNYAENMALWTDATDPLRSFELEVPRRALTEPLLKHAICAFSARHYYRSQSGTSGEAEALDHQNKCLELLIPAMSGSQANSVSTLTAVAVLRQNEEMDDQDLRFHLEGTTRIFNMAPQFTSSEGLGEAAAWLCLREDIYVSLTTQSPMNICTDSFYAATTILKGGDFAWTQKIVVHLAVLLNRAFGAPANHGNLELSEMDVSQWNERKPLSFIPIHFTPRSGKDGRSWPEVMMLSPHHAVGLQYFHIAQIVLQVAKGMHASNRPYEHLAEHRVRERKLRHHLFMVIGIAISNPRAENTWFTARHCLSVWSGCLRKARDQQAAIQFLVDMESRTGWRTAALRHLMQSQWDEESEPE